MKFSDDSLLWCLCDNVGPESFEVFQDCPAKIERNIGKNYFRKYSRTLKLFKVRLITRKIYLNILEYKVLLVHKIAN